jgi:NADH-quinone oxidoreductase subunit N
MNDPMNFAAVFPELLLTLAALVLMMVAAYAGDRATRLSGWIAVIALGVALAHVVQPAMQADDAIFSGLYRADAFSAFAKALIFGAAAACILVAPRFFESGSGGLRAEYPVLILLACIGMSIMVSAADFLTLYVGLELNSLSAYVLAAFMRRDVRSAEAGLKYFVLGGLASGILLYGMSLLYGFSGTTGFAGVAEAITASIATDGYLGGGLLFGLVFVLVGLGFKISAVPMHMWTPDVYEGAPTPVTAFFASAPKVAAIALTVRVAIEALGPQASWQPIIIFAALASIVGGAVAAIPQTNIKRLLAYSSINNVGFALVGLAAGTPEGVAAVMSYLAIYVVMTIGSFACVLQMKDQDGNPVETIDSLAGLSQTRPGLAAAIAIFMFSIAGIPPLFGFWAKFLVFDAAVAANLTALAVFGIAASVIGAFYYLRIVKTMYFDPPAQGFAQGRSAIDYGIIALCATVIVFGYLLNPALDHASAAAAAALF